MRTPQVSIIMAAYNHARYIREAIASALAQTYERWELIVVDDGSTDDTAALLRQFTDLRIRYIYQENQGLAASRNRGIALAHGPYLAFLDSDDVWMPHFLERCVSVLGGESDLAGVYTLIYHINQNSARFQNSYGRVVPPGLLYHQLLEGGWFPPCAAVVRSRIVHEVGLFDTSLQGQGTEDWDLWLRIAHLYPMRGVSEPLACYRVYDGSMSTDVERMHANRLAVLAKHFGQLEGEPQTWPEDKRRAYAFTYRTAALGYIGRGDTDDGWGYLRHALEVEPGLLARLDTFYELALGDQPRGYRGDANALDIEASHAELRRRLDGLFTSSSPSVQAHKRVAFGSGYLALAVLSDQAGNWTAARRYMRRAVRICPALLRDRSVVRRLVKLHLGRRLVGSVRRLRVGAGVMD
jgi:glycosyltransferase involved in cell wall biosynthesis